VADLTLSLRLPSYRFVDGNCRAAPTPAVAHCDRSNHPKGLVKQAYSARVLLSPTEKARKWHLTAYFSYEDLEHIPTVDQDEILRGVTVPPGIFHNGKSSDASLRNSGMKRKGRSHSLDTETSSISSSSPRPAYTTTNCRIMSNDLSPSGDQRPILPPLESTLVPGSACSSGHSTRSAEDQRIIQLLNSRYIC